MPASHLSLVAGVFVRGERGCPRPVVACRRAGGSALPCEPVL